VWFESKLSEEMLKRKPIRPKTGRSKANPEVQKKLKMQRSRSDETGLDRAHHGLPVVFSTDRGEGRTTVRLGRTTVRPLLPLFFLSSFVIVQFPARFLVLSSYFVLKRGVYLALLRGIHRKLSFILKNSIEEEEEGRRRAVKPKRRFWWRIERSAIKHCISFLISCSFFHFLHFG